MKIITLCLVLLSLGSIMQAQSSVRSEDALSSLKKQEMKGDVVVSMDSLIEDNYNKHLVQNKKDIGIEGYRIRIYSNNGLGAKERQQRVRAKFLSLYPEIRTYGPYEGSYYKIYVGDFRTKRDALKILDLISRDFPDAFIVEDKIVIEE